MGVIKEMAPAVREHPEAHDFAYALYAGDPSNGWATRVASFREGRIGYRLWATRTGRINPSVEDRYDHDVDELMA